MTETFKVIDLSPEAKVARKKRNIWLALSLLGFVMLVGTTTAIRISETGSKDGMYFSGYMNEAAVEKEKRDAEARAAAIEAELSASKSEGIGDE
jgi:hypothetical protein